MWQLIAGGGVVSVAACIILGLWGRGWRSEAKHLKDQLTQAKLDKKRLEDENAELREQLDRRDVESVRYEQELEEFRAVVKTISEGCTCGSAAGLLNRLSPSNTGSASGGGMPS